MKIILTIVILPKLTFTSSMKNQASNTYSILWKRNNQTKSINL